MTDMVNITINGKAVEVAAGTQLIDACEQNGTYIPRFCYHPRMTPVGKCRQCIVEVDTGRGMALMPSCMFPVSEGMVVDTESELSRQVQEGMLEHFLINHPLDCPDCDQGGECPLQDQAYSHGPGESRFVEEKRHFEKPISISPLVENDRERCIYCDRCTRFADEVAGDAFIHFMSRANFTEINIFPDEPFASYFSGNTVQICPVGALTATPYRFKARPWDIAKEESTCQTCSVGCRVSVHTSRDNILRLEGVDSDPVNWGWLCDKGRFNYENISHEDRLRTPLVRDRSGNFVAARWAEALDEAATAISEAISKSGPASIGVIGGSRLTNEDAYAWAKLAKSVIGTDNVDAQLGDGLPAEVVLGLPRATIDEACLPGGTILVLGPDAKETLPVLYIRLRHALTNDGARLIEITPTDTGLTELATASVHPIPGHTAEVVRAILEGRSDSDVAGVSREEIARVGELIRNGGPLTVVYGRGSVAEAAGVTTEAVSLLHEALPEARFLPGLWRSNVFGALDMGLAPGVLPGRVRLEDGKDWISQTWHNVPAAPGLDTTGILNAAAEGRIDTLVLLGADPLADFPDADLAARAMAGARTIISLDRFLTESTAKADIVLPAAGFGEVDGTTTNLEGRVSRVAQRVAAPGSAQSDWVVAAELAFKLGADLGFESSEEIWDEIISVSPVHAGLSAEMLAEAANSDGVVVPLPQVVETVVTPTDETDSADTDSIDVGDAEAPEAASEEGSPTAQTTEADAEETDEADETGDARVLSEEATKPALIAFSGPVPSLSPQPIDAYAFRLVTVKKMYDQGTLTAHSHSLAGLLPGAQLRLYPADFDKLGVVDGAQVRLRSEVGSIVVSVTSETTVPRGRAVLLLNQPGDRATTLISSNSVATDVRVEVL